jgi:predicted MFS family arabinose efflux permease
MMDTPSAPSTPHLHARIILLILATVQFTSIVDFMVIMPLEPQLTLTLGLTPDEFSLVVAFYTWGAGSAGLIATLVVDRFARRPAFLTLYAGFLAGTLACGLAPNFLSLLGARFLTGAFGGILGGMALAILGDVFPEKQRGSATGVLMTAFALASVFGVPLGLALGQWQGWHAPFVAIAVLGLPILFVAAWALPRLDAHLHKATQAHPLVELVNIFTERNHLRAFSLTVCLSFGGFAVFTFLPAYLVANVKLAEEDLIWAYVLGGALTLVGAPLIGRLADRYGKLRIYRIVAPVTAMLMLVVTNLPPVPLFVAVLAMGTMMLSNAGRMVPAMAMITSSVAPHRRGGFLGANAAVQHLAAGFGSYIAGLYPVSH